MTVWTAIVVAAFLMPTGDVRPVQGSKGPYVDEATCLAAIAEDRISYPIGHVFPNGTRILAVRFACEERAAPGRGA